ncbi:phosphotransferase family protein [Pseudonocardia sichuanensis]
MENRPDAFTDAGVAAGLSAHYAIEARDMRYLPVGFGDYHWAVTGADGRAWFVKLSDLAHKPQCGPDPDSALAGFRDATATASSLRDDADLEFVLAAHRARGGEAVARLDQRWALSVFPHVEAESFDFYTELTPDRRDEVIDLLARLHSVVPPATTPAHDPAVPDRAAIEAALAALDDPWSGGPFAEPARAALATHSPTVRARLADADRLVAQVHGSGRPLVVTHGEPHPGNLLRRPGGYLLIDWDTVGLAVPERDLAVLADTPAALSRYTDLTGVAPDPAALALYRLRWTLADLVEFIAWFRAPHAHDSDTEAAWEGMTDALERLAAAGEQLDPTAR